MGHAPSEGALPPSEAWRFPPYLACRVLELATVDSLLADPVAERLLDEAELTGDVDHRSVLVDQERGRVLGNCFR